MAALGSVPSRLAPGRVLIVHVVDGSGWDSSESVGEGRDTGLRALNRPQASRQLSARRNPGSSYLVALRDGI